jgi:hypothetical protein
MTDKINQIKYISLAEASSSCEYSQEYLSLRARQRKLQAVKLGRNWFTTKEWLDDYIKENSQPELRGDIQESLEKEPKIGVSLPVVKIQPGERQEKAKIYSVKQAKDHEFRKLLDFWGGSRTKIARQSKKRRPEIQFAPKEKFFLKKAYVQARNNIRNFVAGAYFVFKAPSSRTKEARTIKPAENIYRKIRKTNESFNLLASWLKEGWDWRAATVIVILLFVIIFSIIGVSENITFGKIANCLSGISKSMNDGLVTGFDRATDDSVKMNFYLWTVAGNAPQQMADLFSLTKQKAKEKFINFIFIYKTGLKVAAVSYEQAPDNIAFQWNKAEEGNGVLKIKFDLAAQKTFFAVKSLPRKVVINCINYTLAVKNIAVRTANAVMFSLDKAGSFSSGYGQKIGKKCTALGSEINLLVKNPLLVGEACKETTLGPAKLFSGKIFTALNTEQAEIARLAKKLKSQAQEFIYTYGVGLRVAQVAYQRAPLNLVEGWNGLEAGNNLAKKGLKNSIGYSGHLAMSETMEILKGEKEEAAIVVRLLSTRISAIGNQGIAIAKKDILSIFSGKRLEFREFFASAFGQAQQIVNQKFNSIYSFFQEASRKLAEKFVQSYELAINYKNSLFSPKQKEEANNAKLAEQSVKKGLIVVPSTSKDEEIKKQIQQNFSDEVKVDIKDENSGIITPVFKNKAGDKYLYMMVPLSEQN